MVMMKKLWWSYIIKKRKPPIGLKAILLHRSEKILIRFLAAKALRDLTEIYLLRKLAKFPDDVVQGNLQ